MKPIDDYEGIHQLLTVAGANVRVSVIRTWSQRKRAVAIRWAKAQVEVWAKDKLGWQTSVRWPEHVSSAHRERPVRRRTHVKLPPSAAAESGRTAYRSSGRIEMAPAGCTR